MVCISTPVAFGNKWQVFLQSDNAPSTMPQSGKDVVNLPQKDDYKFFPGSTLMVLSPVATYRYGEDDTWYQIG